MTAADNSKRIIAMFEHSLKIFELAKQSNTIECTVIFFDREDIQRTLRAGTTCSVGGLLETMSMLMTRAQMPEAGGTVLSGMCFYQSYAREMAEAHGWKRLVTNSAKMVNILGGYGYQGGQDHVDEQAPTKVPGQGEGTGDQGQDDLEHDPINAVDPPGVRG